MVNPKYPVYIVSKGRWESRLTSKALEKINVPYYIVIDANEYEQYARVIDPKKILIMPQKYYDEYDTFDDLGNTKAKGPGASRNFCWDHSISLGAKRHWVLDDNIADFYRLNNNLRVRVDSGVCFRVCEDFVDRYTNIPMAGMQYRFFAPSGSKHRPFTLNTRIYSIILLQNDIPQRWRGRYNEDTDLSLRILKDGGCTVLFYVFLADKAATQVVKGGNTEQFYSKEGTLPKSEMQVKMHPDVSTLVWRFNRWHHYVDYRPFRKNRLKRRADIEFPTGINNYGMVLMKTTDLDNLMKRDIK